MISEKAEQAEKTLEERLENYTDAEHEVRIEQVHEVTRMIEGSQTYAQIRAMVKLFVRALERGDPQAQQMLLLKNLRPETRYAALRLVMDSLQADGIAPPDALQQERRDLMTQHGARLRSLFGAGTSAAASGEPGAPPAALADMPVAPVLQILALKATVRSIYDTALNLGEPQGLGDSLNVLQQRSAGLLGQADRAGVLAIITNLICAARSMLAYARELEERQQKKDKDDAEKRRAARHLRARLLLDIANSSVPSGLIDKLLASLHPGRLPPTAATKSAVLSVLHRQVRRWPDVVFAGTDSRKLVLDQLVRMQSMSRLAISTR
jgi:hypothetical protein